MGWACSEVWETEGYSGTFNMLLNMYRTGIECLYVGQDSFGTELRVIGSCDKVTNLLVSWSAVSFSSSALL
jgi:hypothetical protein